MYPLGDRYKNCLLLRLREGGKPAVDMSSNREIVSLHAFQFKGGEHRVRIYKQKTCTINIFFFSTFDRHSYGK